MASHRSILADCHCDLDEDPYGAALEVDLPLCSPAELAPGPCLHSVGTSSPGQYGYSAGLCRVLLHIRSSPVSSRGCHPCRSQRREEAQDGNHESHYLPVFRIASRVSKPRRPHDRNLLTMKSRWRCLICHDGSLSFHSPWRSRARAKTTLPPPCLSDHSTAPPFAGDPAFPDTLPGAECVGRRSRWRWCSGRSWVREPRADGRIAGEEGERND
jgi:hypothetical protein